MSALGAAANAVIDLVPTDAAGSNPVTWDDLAVPLQGIHNVLKVLAQAMEDADNKLQEAVTAATDAATQFENIGNDVKSITEHTYTVVIPHSMSWLAGYVVTHWIDPLRRAVAILNEEVAKIEQWEAEIRVWRAHFVDPNITLWVGFREWFNTWPRGVLFRWHDWFEHPDHFAQWAAPPLTGPIVSYLAAPGHKQARDNLMLILLRAMQEDRDPAWEAVLQFMVTSK